MENEELLKEIFKQYANLDIDADILVDLLQKNFKGNGVNFFNQDIVINKKIYTLMIKYDLSNYKKVEKKNFIMSNYKLKILNVGLHPYNFDPDLYCFEYSVDN